MAAPLFAIEQLTARPADDEADSVEVGSTPQDGDSGGGEADGSAAPPAD